MNIISSLLFFASLIHSAPGPFSNFSYPSRLGCSKSGYAAEFQLYGAQGYNDIQFKPINGELSAANWTRLLAGEEYDSLTASGVNAVCSEAAEEYEVWICLSSHERCDGARPRHIGNVLVNYELPFHSQKKSYYSALTNKATELSITDFSWRKQQSSLEAFDDKTKVFLSFMSEDIDFKDKQIKESIREYLSELYAYVSIYKTWPKNFDVELFIAHIFRKSLAKDYPIIVPLLEHIRTPFDQEAKVSVSTSTTTEGYGTVFGKTPRKLAAIDAALQIEGSEHGKIRACIHQSDGPKCDEHIRKWDIEMKTRRNFVFEKVPVAKKEFTASDLNDRSAVAKYMYGAIAADLDVYRSFYPPLQLSQKEEDEKCAPWVLPEKKYESDTVLDKTSMTMVQNPQISSILLRYCRFRHFLKLTSFASTTASFTPEQLETFRTSLKWVNYLNQDISVVANISEDVFYPGAIAISFSLPAKTELEKLAPEQGLAFEKALNYLKQKYEKSTSYKTMGNIASNIMRAIQLRSTDSPLVQKDLQLREIFNLFLDMSNLLADRYPHESMFRLFLYKAGLNFARSEIRKISWDHIYPLLQILSIASPKPSEANVNYKQWASLEREKLYSAMKISEQFILNNKNLVEQVGMRNMPSFMQNFRGSVNAGVFALINSFLGLSSEQSEMDPNLCSMPFDIIGRLSMDKAAKQSDIFIAEKLPANDQLYSSAALVIVSEGGLFSHAALDLMEQSVPAIIGLREATNLPKGKWAHFSCRPGEYLRGEIIDALSESCKQLLDDPSVRLDEACDNDVVLNQVADRLIVNGDFSTVATGNNKLQQIILEKLNAKREGILDSYPYAPGNLAKQNAYREQLERISAYFPNDIKIQKFLATHKKPKFYSKGESLQFLRNRLNSDLHFDEMIKVNVPPLFVIDRLLIKNNFDFKTGEFQATLKDYIEKHIADMKFPVIARSSSQLEDSSSNRAAGIFKSVKAVNKDALYNAIREVIESDVDEKAQEYKKRIKVSPDFSMSVIVQEYVPRATISGVLMTSTDSKRWEMAELQVVEGFGSGVEGDEAVSLFKINTETKKIASGSNFAVPFDPQVIVSIAIVGKVLEEIYGYVLDIEWVYDDQSKTLWIVQAAPKKINI